MSKKITLQKIFDLAWEHFIVGDGEPGYSEHTGCTYKTPDGRKCAVGLALPENPDGYEYEGSFRTLVLDYPELFDDSVLKRPRDSLNAFQSGLHDDLVDKTTGEWRFNKEEMKAKYLAVAESFGLTVPSH